MKYILSLWYPISRSFVFLTLCIIVTLAVQNNITEHLSEKNYSTPSILICRSIICLFLSCSFCKFKGHSLFPANWRLQLIRMANSGIAIFFITASFNYLSAASVGVLQRLDIPIMALISQGFIGLRTSHKSWLSLGVFGLVGLFIILSKKVDESPVGFLLAISSVTMLSWGYLLLKKLINHENRYVLINTTCLGCIAVSIFSLLWFNEQNFKLNVEDLNILLIAGVAQYILYSSMAKIYKNIAPDLAQFPFVLGAVGTMFVEMWIEEKNFGILHTAIMLSIMILITFIVFTKDNNHLKITTPANVE